MIYSMTLSIASIIRCRIFYRSMASLQQYSTSQNKEIQVTIICLENTDSFVPSSERKW